MTGPDAIGSEAGATPRSARDFLASIAGAPRRNFALCFVGLMVCTADQAFFSYAIPSLVKEFGVSLDVIGAALSASFALAIVTVVLAGMLADRFGRVRVFALLLGLSAGVVVLHAFAQSFATLAVLRAVSFAVAAGLYPIANTIVVESAPARYRGVLAGTLQISYPLGFFVGSLVAAHFLAAAGWRAAFLAALAVIPLAVVIDRFMDEPRPFARLAASGAAAARPGTPLAQLLSPQWRGTVIACFVGSALTSIAIGGITLFLPTYLVESRGVSSSVAAEMAGMTFLIGAFGYVLSSYIGEFVLTRRDTLIAWVWLGAVVFGSVVWVAESSTVVIVGLGVTIMFLFGSEAVRMPLAAELFPAELRVTGSTLAGSAGVTLGLLIVPLVIGSIAPRIGWALTYTFCGVVPLVAAGFAFLLLRNRKSAEALDAPLPEASPATP